MQISNSYDYQSNAATKDTPWIRRTFIVIAVLFMVLMLVVPLLAVFYEAFKTAGSYILRHWLTLRHYKRSN